MDDIDIRSIPRGVYLMATFVRCEEKTSGVSVLSFRNYSVSKICFRYFVITLVFKNFIFCRCVQFLDMFMTNSLSDTFCYFRGEYANHRSADLIDITSTVGFLIIILNNGISVGDVYLYIYIMRRLLGYFLQYLTYCMDEKSDHKVAYTVIRLDR